MSNIFIKFAQKQMGTGHLEAHSTSELIKSIFSKIIQSFSGTRLPVGSEFRCALERIRGVNIGKHVFMGGGSVLDRVKPELITIEDYVSIAGNVVILTHSNPTQPLREILGSSADIKKPVKIKRGAWIAVNCVILPGVTIGENAIVSCGSVVNKDVPDHTIVGGVPAKFIKKISRSNN